MDDFKDFFKELKERATSPLFGSFIISWCLINWPVLIALFFKNDEKTKDRYTFIYDLILIHYNFFSFFLFPALFAIIYTIGYPWVRRKIKLHIAKQQAFGDSEILKSTGISTVSLNNYLIMKDAQEASQAKLSDLINDQQNVLSDLEKLRNELNSEKLNNLALLHSIQEVKAAREIAELFEKLSTYSGIWHVFEPHSQFGTNEWIIESGIIDIGDGKGPKKIISFSADVSRRQISFQVKISKMIKHKFVETYRVQEGMALQMNNTKERTHNLEVPIEQDEVFVFKVSDDLNTLTLIHSVNRKSFDLVRSGIPI